MTDDERRMVIRKYPRAFFSNCMQKVLSENGAAGIVLGDNWADAAARIRAEQAAIPETVVAPKERKYPIGGDPKDFCICGHHEMCHADYAEMPRACNQTGCGCRNYQLESVVAPKPTSQQDCQHRSIQLCKQQLDVVTVYVCGKCSAKFQVEPLAEPKPQPKEPMFPKHSVPWGQRSRQA